MKILVLANKDGGLYNFRKELIRELISSDNEVYISLPYGDKIPLLEKLGCKFIDTPVDRRGVNPIADFKLLLNYHKIIKKVKPDVVLSYTIKPNLYGGICCKLLKIPFLSNITGLGTGVNKNAVINAEAEIGKHCIINTAAVIEHDNKIGDYVHVSPNATLCGTVSVGDNTHIGAGAVVKNNISIASDVVLGCGSCVVKNIEKSGTYAGTPVKEL